MHIVCLYLQRSRRGRSTICKYFYERGTVNLHTASSTCREIREFLATPNHDVQFVNTDTTINLIIFTVYPMIM